MNWQDIIKIKQNKIVGTAVRQAIANYMEETGNKDTYQLEEILPLFSNYTEITGQKNTGVLRGKFEESVMRYIPEGYGKLKEMLTDKRGYPVPSSINSAITGWQRI